ncbi:MAG TPA: dethiobiotin synthase, partial [Candidatus Baltobacteraceae bacterium]|nr:dethiobiotin synthase [Candidatus Baltobacteraceae bacterium]
QKLFCFDRRVARTLFITGTDTGAGKTVLTTLLVKFLRARGVNAAALKPICSGGRDDARKIFAAMDGAVSLDEINPWHFRAPVAPLLAARRENKKVKLSEVVAHVCAIQKQFDVLIVEGAGGLLSPLGERFDSRDLILKLRATPIVVAQNKLGAINQILLTLEALPNNFQRKTKIVLMSPEKLDAAAASNVKLLGELFDSRRIYQLPRFKENFTATNILKNPRVAQTLRALAY